MLLGLLSAAWNANECMRLAVAGQPPFSIADQPPPACDADELAEEGLSPVECRRMAHAVHDISLSSPEWFRPVFIGLSAAGSLFAALSVVAALGLVDGRRWAAGASIAAFTALLAVDVAAFAAVVNTGPLIRQGLLWNILVWSFVHLILLTATVAAHPSTGDPRRSPGADPLPLQG